MPKTTFLCDFRTPPGERECLEMLWSEGRACADCYRERCYRHGWARTAVLADNKRFVAEKRRRLYG